MFKRWLTGRSLMAWWLSLSMCSGLSAAAGQLVSAPVQYLLLTYCSLLKLSGFRLIGFCILLASWTMFF
jgi:hypothetical protein